LHILVSYLVLFKLFFGNFLHLLFTHSFVWQGLILSKALKAQKDAEDDNCQIAHGNLRSEVITLRNEALTKDKILLPLVERLKSSEAKLSAQAEAHKAEVQELENKVAEATKNFNVELTKHEICEIERSRAHRNVDELRAAKKKMLRCGYGMR
jgi:predicted RNase H-like nuclease (RuvC/YqgF family)